MFRLILHCECGHLQAARVLEREHHIFCLFCFKALSPGVTLMECVVNGIKIMALDEAIGLLQQFNC